MQCINNTISMIVSENYIIIVLVNSFLSYQQLQCCSLSHQLCTAPDVVLRCSMTDNYTIHSEWLVLCKWDQRHRSGVPSWKPITLSHTRCRDRWHYEMQHDNSYQKMVFHKLSLHWCSTRSKQVHGQFWDRSVMLR